MKITNQEWKAFWETIGDDWYIEDDDAPENVETAPMFELTCEEIRFQGMQVPHSHPVISPMEIGQQCADLIVVFRRWKTHQKVTTLVIEGDKDTVADVTAAVKSAGWRVVK